MLLNALQPTGITTVALDRNNLAAVLGAAAAVAPLLTIQSLDSTNFLNLCTVISPVGHAPFGAPVLRLRLATADKQEANLEVKYGTLEVIKLPPARVEHSPSPRCIASMLALVGRAGRYPESHRRRTRRGDRCPRSPSALLRRPWAAPGYA